MRVALICLIVLLALSACDKTAFAPVEVKVPVVSKCEVKLPARPDYNLPHVKSSDSLVDKVKAALADIELYKGYTLEIEAAALSCSTSHPK